MIKKNEVIGYDNSGFRGIVLEDVLKMFAEKSIVELAPQAYPEESSQKILTEGKEEIGFHKGALNTLANERNELFKMMQNVEGIMQAHLKRLEELGVKIEQK